MKVITPENDLVFNKRSVFLAGTTPKNRKDNWREKVISALESAGFDGVVYNPDYTDNATRLSYADQIMWEINAMKISSVIAFWVDRDMKHRPGLTTNVEFGYYIKNNNVVYGRPTTSEKCFYLDTIYKFEQNTEPANNLEDFIKQIINKVNTVVK